MKKETKFNYGLLSVGLALPIIADYFLGKAWGVIVAIVVGAVGTMFLVSGHTHREEGQTVPVSRRRKMAAFAVVGAVVSLALMGIHAVYAHEFMANRPSIQPSATQSPSPSPPKNDQNQVPGPTQNVTAQEPQPQAKQQKKATYSVTNATGSIVNQNSEVKAPQTVNNNYAPPPPQCNTTPLQANSKIHLGANSNGYPEDYYESTFGLELVSTSTVPSLYIKAEAPSIVTIATCILLIKPHADFASTALHSIGARGWCDTHVQSVEPGSYELKVNSREPEMFTITCKAN